MKVDKTTLHDLSFLEGTRSVFQLLNACTTQKGSEVLRRHILTPPANRADLLLYQDGVRFWMNHPDSWTEKISNGTLVMLESFFESADTAPERPTVWSLMMDSLLQKVFNKDAWSFIRFSISHLSDFMKGCAELTALRTRYTLPQAVLLELEALDTALQLPLCQQFLTMDASIGHRALLMAGFRARREMKATIYKMILHYARLDAMRALGLSAVRRGWNLPRIEETEVVTLEAEGLFHPLLERPVPYTIRFDADHAFLFLTGANMSGKSTFIRSLGICALLAHIGAAVPAEALRISFLQGIITNMEVSDNIFKGESYFMAEVQRMKITARKLADKSHQLVLMDELFKGTNVHDAYECSRAVIQGLLQQRNNLMVLSTHLNELSASLEKEAKLFFKYCYTEITAAGQYTFTYTLKDGVSKDRIGYLVLKNEGVLQILRGEK